MINPFIISLSDAKDIIKLLENLDYQLSLLAQYIGL